MRLHRLLIACLALGSLSLPGQAVASGPAKIDTAQLITAFTAICLDHIADSPAQTAAGTAAPWLLVQDGAPDNGLTFYRSDTLAMGIRSGDGQSCGVTANVPLAQDLATVSTLVGTTLGLGEGQADPDNNSHYWMIQAEADSQRFAIAIKVSGVSGENVATLLLQKL